MKIDVFPHILPRRYFDRLEAVAPASLHMMKRFRNVPVLFDLDKRLEIMDRHEGYVQVLTLAAPPIEEAAEPARSPELATLANDEMAALVDRHPNLKIITHHCGAMIPYFEGRVGGGLDQLGKRSDDPDDLAARSRLQRRPIDYFRLFYGDTALFGSTAGLECGVAFFGAERVLFGTDMPFDPEGGPGFVRDTIASIDRMRISDQERQLIYEGNARRLLRLRVAGSG